MQMDETLLAELVYLGPYADAWSDRSLTMVTWAKTTWRIGTFRGTIGMFRGARDVVNFVSIGNKLQDTPESSIQSQRGQRACPSGLPQTRLPFHHQLHALPYTEDHRVYYRVTSAERHGSNARQGDDQPCKFLPDPLLVGRLRSLDVRRPVRYADELVSKPQRLGEISGDSTASERAGLEGIAGGAFECQRRRPREPCDSILSVSMAGS